MTTEIMTFNEFIAELAGRKLVRYVEDRYDDLIKEEFDEEMDKYYTGDYEIHLHYLIETWKNSIDEDLYNFKIDYEYKGTYDELYEYYLDTPCPSFEPSWLDDIFVRQILVTTVSLK